MQELFKAELTALNLYCDAVSRFTAAGFPGLAKWAAREAEEELRHAFRAARFYGEKEAREENDPDEIVAQVMADVVASETALHNLCVKASEEYEEAEDRVFAEEVLMVQVKAVAEAVAMEVRARRNAVALDLSFGGE